MRRFLALRLAMSAIAVVLAAAFTFALIHLSPTDPVTLALGDGASAEQRRALSEQLGLNRSLAHQFGAWLGGALHGDFGQSIFTHQAVGAELARRLPVTLSLVGGAVLLALAIGLGLGFAAGLRRGSWADRVVTTVVSVGLAVPAFWLALLLSLAFAVKVRLFPVAGYTALTQDPFQWARGLVLPCFALSLYSAAVIARHMRGAVVDVLGSPYVEAVRARGTSRALLVRRYVLKNALATVTPVIGIQVAVLLATSVVMERVFVLPGIGSLLVSAVISSDFPILQGAILVVATLVILVNLLVDVGLGLLDPRVRPQ